MIFHPLLLRGLDTRLKTQRVRDSRLLLIHRLTQAFFLDAPTIAGRVVQFDILGTTFIPRIFEARDWADLFGNFEDPVDELVKEFYFNARYTRVELKCWVRGTEFSINLEYIAKVLRITKPANMDLTSYDDRLLQTIGKTMARSAT